MNPARRILVQHVAEAIEARGTGDIGIRMLAEQIIRDHPDEVLALSQEAARHLVVGMIENQLKPNDPQTPQLDGFELPARLPIPTEGGTIYRAAEICTRDDWNAYPQMLSEQITADQKRLRLVRREVAKVIAVLDQHGVDRLADLP